MYLKLIIFLSRLINMILFWNIRLVDSLHMKYIIFLLQFISMVLFWSLRLIGKYCLWNKTMIQDCYSYVLKHKDIDIIPLWYTPHKISHHFLRILRLNSYNYVNLLSNYDASYHKEYAWCLVMMDQLDDTCIAWIFWLIHPSDWNNLHWIYR